mgnify:CR=1 FL=1
MTPIALRKVRTFRSTLPREERPRTRRGAWLGQPFRSTLPREERHVLEDEEPEPPKVRSTLPREERRPTPSPPSPT